MVLEGLVSNNDDCTTKITMAVLSCGGEVNDPLVLIMIIKWMHLLRGWMRDKVRGWMRDWMRGQVRD